MTRQEAIEVGKGVAKALNSKVEYLIIGLWSDSGEYWCEAGTRTEEAANEKRAQLETTMENHPRPATFEVVQIVA